MDYYLFVSWLVRTFGYFGILIVSAILTGTILLPYPAGIISTLGGAALNPYLVGIFAGIGAGIGEMTGYGLGYGGKRLLEKKFGKKVARRDWKNVEKLFHKYGGLLIFAGATVPFPFDVLGMFCGAIKYNPKKFFVLTTCGKIIQHAVFAVTGQALINLII